MTRRSGCCRRRARTRRRRTRGRGRRRAAAAGRGSSLPQLQPRAPRSGIGKSTIASSRRVNASSMLARRLVARIARPSKRLHPLQQVGDSRRWRSGRGRRGPRERLPNSASASSNSSTPLTPVGLGEDPLEVLLGLADVLVDDRRQVDDVEVEPEVAGDHLGRHRLAGAGVAGEQRGDAAARGRRPAASATRRAPARGAGPGRRARAAAPRRRSGSTRSSQPTRRLDAAGEALEAGGVLRPGARLQQVGGRRAGRRGWRRAAPTGRRGRSGRGRAAGARGQQNPAASPSAVGPQPSRSAGASRGASACSGTSRLHAGSQLTSPASSTGNGSDASRRRASAAASVRASTGSATSPHPRSRASRPASGPAPPAPGGSPADAGRARRRRSRPPPAPPRRPRSRCAGRGRAGRPAGPDPARGDRLARSAGWARQAGSVTAQDPAQVVGEPARGRGDLGEDVGQRGVRVVGPEQVRGHPVRHPQAAGEERPLRVLDGHEQVLHQRRPRGQPPARGGCGRPGGAELQGQPDRGPAPGDVVVEVAVEPLEPGVEVRDERDEQDLDVEVGQAAGLLQRPQPRRAGGLLDGLPSSRPSSRGGPGVRAARSRSTSSSVR